MKWMQWASDTRNVEREVYSGRGNQLVNEVVFIHDLKEWAKSDLVRWEERSV